MKTDSWIFFSKHYANKKGVSDRTIKRQFKKMGFTDSNYIVINKSVEFIINEPTLLRLNTNNPLHKRVKECLDKQIRKGIIDL